MFIINPILKLSFNENIRANIYLYEFYDHTTHNNNLKCQIYNDDLLSTNININNYNFNIQLDFNNKIDIYMIDCFKKVPLFYKVNYKLFENFKLHFYVINDNPYLFLHFQKSYPSKICCFKYKDSSSNEFLSSNILYAPCTNVKLYFGNKISQQQLVDILITFNNFNQIIKQSTQNISIFVKFNNILVYKSLLLIKTKTSIQFDANAFYSTLLVSKNYGTYNNIYNCKIVYYKANISQSFSQVLKCPLNNDYNNFDINLNNKMYNQRNCKCSKILQLDKLINLNQPYILHIQIQFATFDYNFKFYISECILNLNLFKLI